MTSNSCLYSFGYFLEEPLPTLLELAERVPEQVKEASVDDILMRHIEQERERASFDFIASKMRQEALERERDEAEAWRQWTLNHIFLRPFLIRPQEL